MLHSGCQEGDSNHPLRPTNSRLTCPSIPKRSTERIPGYRYGDHTIPEVAPPIPLSPTDSIPATLWLDGGELGLVPHALRLDQHIAAGVECRHGTYADVLARYTSTAGTNMQNLIKTIVQITAGLALALALSARAEDKKLDLTGNWKSSYTNQNGQVRESVFKLKAEGEKLTGTVSGRQNDTAIEQGKIKGEEVSFQVTREYNGNKMVFKYTGKVSGDTIKGKFESERDGQPQKRDWEAKREAAK